jgi:Domain of unknown function (DUF4276)
MTRQVRLACVVEGQGDERAVPILVRRVAAALDPMLGVSIVLMVRRPKSKLLRPPGLEDAVELAARATGQGGAILVLLDSDDDCPAELGPRLLERARAQRGDRSLAVVLAKREFEAWFLADAESLRGQQGLPGDLQAPPDAEAISDAKGWLSDRMPRGETYVETRHQPAFAASLDLDRARRADSFDKCYRDLARLLTEARS